MQAIPTTAKTASNLCAVIERNAVFHRDGLAIVSGSERRTWAEVRQRIGAIANGLLKMGVQPSDRVGTLAFNSSLCFESMMAVWWIGGVLVPVNTRLAIEEMRVILEHADAKLLVTDMHFAELGAGLKEEVNSLQVHFALDDTYCADFGARPTPDCLALSADTLAALFYTGGTTGRPKGVMLTHANFMCSAANMQRDLRQDSKTVYLHAAPLFHVADFGIGAGVCLAAGGHSFIARFSTAEFYDRLRTDGVTHLQLVPTMLAMVLDAPERDDSLLARILSLSYGAAPSSEALLLRILEAFPRARIQQFYGMTECCGASVMLPSERHVLNGKNAGKLRSAGHAITGFELGIVDNSLTELPPGETGEIVMRGPAVMQGYWKDSRLTEAALETGWLRSGDVGWIDVDGFVFVVDRLKDMIISGGENVYCGEVESVLATHPGVQAGAVIGLPDELWGERVHAVVICKDNAEGLTLTPEVLDAHCRAHLAGYKVPRSFDIRLEPLPLSAVGKVQKNRLRDEWNAKKEYDHH